MAAVIGTVRANFIVETATAIRNIKKARASLKSNTSKMNVALIKLRKSADRVGGAMRRRGRSVFSLKGINGILAGGALGLLIKRNIEAADAIAKTADTIGITTDALQELRFAGEIAGVAVGAMDSALQAFGKRVGEARVGTGTLVEILKKMNPTLLKNITSVGTTTEALDLMFKAIAKLPNQMDRAALASAAFGR